MGSSDAPAFDGLANDYDRTFTHTRVGLGLRAMVWRRLDLVLPAQARVLELGCGTGEDAVWLARAGHQVVALDASPEMIRVARIKAAMAGCADRIDFHCLPMEALGSLPGGARFDAVLSNFGAANCVPDVGALAEALHARLEPGATLLFAVMGPYVPWEWLWYLAHGQWGRAFRRLRRGGVTWRGLPISYPSPASFAAKLLPHFAASRVSALGCVLPPSYAASWLEGKPRVLRVLAGIERKLAEHPAFANIADHYLFEARHQPFEASLLERQPKRLWRSFAKRVVDLVYQISGRQEYDDFRLEQVAGLRILVLPSVSNPKVLRTGEFFARQIAAFRIEDHTSVLDLGTGSGICALQAARRARTVVAVDINDAAVRCTRINADLNDIGHRVDARVGDLFDAVADRRFDLIFFNPPFCDGAPRNAREAAWRSADLAPRFARELGAHLTPSGVALLLLSSWGDACPRFELELRRQGFALSVLAVRRHVNEIVTILKVVRP